MNKDVAELLKKVVGPFDRHCSSSGLLPGNAYITTPLIAAGVSPIECSHSGSHMLDDIVAFDRAESSYANITQTNMVTVSSFNGPNGLILGYDFLKQERRRHPLIDSNKHPDVYDAAPLFQATQALYGTVADKHFPVMPGEHILCAYKTKLLQGPCLIYGALGIAIPEDRKINADLYMEDHGTLTIAPDPEEYFEEQTMVLENLIRSIGKVSQNLGVRYEKIFVGIQCQRVEVGETGCIITAAPYIHLARKAVPENDPSLLIDMPISEWQQRVSENFLKRQP